MAETESIQDRLKRRARLMTEVRRFFAERAVLEVDTPLLSAAAPTAPYLDSFVTQCSALQSTQNVYLHTSPEFAMKRLLAAGSGPIYQICHVFRNGELGRVHSPEFTMLEWYRPGFDLSMLMQEVDDLMQQLAGCPPAVRYRYADLLQSHLQLDGFNATTEQLQACALAHIPALPADWHTDRDGWLELLMSQVIEPQLAKLQQPVLVYDFPASQAQLARLTEDDSGRQVAARFELYAGGLELANGYDELTDAEQLAARFAADNAQRQRQGLPLMPVDQQLLAALRDGLPACSGVALGLDRLLMLISGAEQLAKVQSIDFRSS